MDVKSVGGNTIELELLFMRIPHSVCKQVRVCEYPYTWYTCHGHPVSRCYNEWVVSTCNCTLACIPWYANLSRIHSSLQDAAEPMINWASSSEVLYAVQSSSTQKGVLLDLAQLPMW